MAESRSTRPTGNTDNDEDSESSCAAVIVSKVEQAAATVQGAVGRATEAVSGSALAGKVTSLGESVGGVVEERPLVALLVAGAVGYALACLVHGRRRQDISSVRFPKLW